MPLRNPKRGKREHAEGQKRGARKSPKIVRNWGYRWRLWKQKVKSAGDARVSRAWARNALISSETRVITPRFSITPYFRFSQKGSRLTKNEYATLGHIRK